MFCTMQNKLCLNVRFATGLSPVASSHDLPHAKFIFKRACLETQPGQAMPARQRNLLRFILFDDFSYARFSSFVSLIVCMRQIGCATPRCRRHLGLKFSYIHTHLSPIYLCGLYSSSCRHASSLIAALSPFIIPSIYSIESSLELMDSVPSVLDAEHTVVDVFIYPQQNYTSYTVYYTTQQRDFLCTKTLPFNL